MKGLVIIPAYNEQDAILKTIKNIEENAPSFDYIVINDCSKDQTLEILERNNINHVNLPVNSGIGAAVQTGYIYAKRKGYDCAVQMDGDGQHDAAFLEKMVEKMKYDNTDMIIGSRFINMEGFQSSRLRRIGIKFFSKIIHRLTGHWITDPTSGMRLANKKIIEMFAESYPKDYPEPETIVTVLKRGYKVEEIPVKMKARESGVSSISLRKSVYYMVKVTMACIFAAIQ